MFEYFLERYKDKEDAELQSIFNNKIDYREEAVNAAIKIYNDRNNTNIPFLGDSNDVKKEQKKATKWNPLKFINSLKFSDFYTLIITSVFLISIYSLISLYQDEFFLKGNSVWIEKLLFFSSFILIHVFFRNDHNISNPYSGRIQFDILYLITYFLLRFLFEFIFGSFYTTYYINLGSNPLPIIFIIILFVCLLELVVELIKKILQALRIEIL